MFSLVSSLPRLTQRVQSLHRAQTVNPDIPFLTASDVIASIVQTEVWICVEDESGRRALAQAKLAGHEVEIADYPRHRIAMRGSDASRLARRWGNELPPGHAAYGEVCALAAGLGTVPRKGFVVVELDKVPAPQPLDGADDPAAIGADQAAIVQAISALIPLLGAGGLTRVRQMLPA